MLEGRAFHRVDRALHGFGFCWKSHHQAIQSLPQRLGVHRVLGKQTMGHDRPVKIRKDAPRVLKQGFHGGQAPCQVLDGFALLYSMCGRGLFVHHALIVERFPPRSDASPGGGSGAAKTEGGGKKSSQHRVHRSRSLSWPLYALRHTSCSPLRFVTRFFAPKRRTSRGRAHRLKSGVRASWMDSDAGRLKRRRGNRPRVGPR